MFYSATANVKIEHQKYKTVRVGRKQRSPDVSVHADV